METTPKTAAKVGALNLSEPLSAASVESTHAATPVADTANLATQGATATVNSRAPQTSRFPTRARNPGSEGQTSVETEFDSFSSQSWVESARNAVRAHPLAVVGVALVAGLLVGRL